MLAIGIKNDNTNNSTGQLDASEFNDLESELQQPVINTGQQLNVSETPQQLSKAMFTHGSGAQAFVENSGTANLSNITPFSGGGLIVFSVAFITGNAIALAINGTPINVSFTVSNTNTYAAIQSAIAAAFPSATVSANATNLDIYIYQAGVVYTITAAVTGGASQPNNQVSYGLIMPDSYNQMNGFLLTFQKSVVNTGVPQINIGQTTSGLMGAQNVVLPGGSAVPIGGMSGMCEVRFNLANSYWELLFSDGLNSSSVPKIQEILTGPALNYKAALPYSVELSYGTGTGATFQVTNRNGTTISAVPSSGTQFSAATDATHPKGSRKVFVSGANSTAQLPVSDNSLRNLGLGATDFTINFWINVNSSNAQNANILQFGLPSAVWFLVNYVQASGKINITDSTTGSILTESNVVGTNAWHMYTIKRASGTFTIYRDNVADGTAAGSNSYAVAGLTSIASGNVSGSITNTLFGSLSDVYVFGRALASQEITALFTGGTFDSEIPYNKLAWSTALTASPVDSSIAASRTLTITQPSAQDADISLLTSSNNIPTNATTQQQRSYDYAGGIPLMSGQSLYFDYLAGFGDQRDYYIVDNGTAFNIKKSWVLIANYNSQAEIQLIHQIMPRSATVIVAASDSSAKGAANADYICNGYNDDVVIQAAITYVSGLKNGGSVILLEGAYNIYTNILVASNVDIKGQGAGSVLRRMTAALTQVIQVNNAIVNFTLSDFQIDGNAGSSYAINCSNNTSNTNSKYLNIIATNFITTSSMAGFNNCVNMINCSMSISGSGGTATVYGYNGCYYVTQCASNITRTGLGYAYGYNGCYYVTQCASTTTASNGSGNCYAYGYNGCYYVTQCASTTTANGSSGGFSYGISGSSFLLNCTCIALAGNLYGNGTAIGISTSTNIVSCTVSATGNGGGGFGYGMYQCHHLSLNVSVSAGGTTYGYKSCFADNGSVVPLSGGGGGAVAADVAAYGWNTGTAAA